MKFISRSFAGLLTAAAIVMPAFADELAGAPTGDEIAEKVNARDEGEFVTRNLTMRLVDRRGKERVRETFGYRRSFGDEKRSVIFYLSPANIKDTGFLTYDYADPARDDDQWLYLPATRKSRRISSSDRGDSFLGTDFSYEDIKMESKISVVDYTRKTIGEEEIDGHHCYVVESFPIDEKTAKELGYGKVVVWIDSTIWMSRKSEFWDIRLNPLKTLRQTDIQEIDGIWTGLKMEVKNHKTGHTTFFTFSDVDYEADVPEDVFSERALRRGAPAN